MKIQAIKCDKCGKVFKEDSDEILHLNGEISKKGVSVLKGDSDYCLSCFRSALGLLSNRVGESLKKDINSPLDCNKISSEPFIRWINDDIPKGPLGGFIVTCPTE